MASFIGKSLSSLFGKKKDGKKGKKKRKKGAAKKTRPATTEATSVDPDTPRPMTPERKKIIENAMAVQRAKANIFNDLNDEQKQRLYALAVKTLLRQGPDDKSH
jgi:hypothetical protein